jgi:hypothetical protein
LTEVLVVQSACEARAGSKWRVLMNGAQFF